MILISGKRPYVDSDLLNAADLQSDAHRDGLSRLTKALKADLRRMGLGRHLANDGHRRVSSSWPHLAGFEIPDDGGVSRLPPALTLSGPARAASNSFSGTAASAW